MTTIVRTSPAYLTAINLADVKFRSTARTADAQDTFRGALVSLRHFAFGNAGTDQGRALATYFAQRIEGMSGDHVAFVAGHMDAVAAQRFDDRMTGMSSEAARSFMVVAGLDVEHIAPCDYPSLSRYYLHLLNLLMD